MACFDNIIALKELCTEQTPSSGVYLNDVGVDLNLVNSVITKEYASPDEFVAAKINSALTEVKNEIYTAFSKGIVTKTVVDNSRVGYTQPNLQVVTGGDYRGVYFQVYNNANYFEVEIASVDLHVNFTGTVAILVYDLDQNKLLDTFNVSAVAGEIVTSYQHLKYLSSKKVLNLWIGYDATGIDSYKTVTHSGQCCGNYCLNNGYIRAKGTSLTGSFIASNLTTLQDTAGISLTYSLTCDSFNWMCSFSNILALPIAYKVASDIYRTAFAITPQSRSNNQTTIQSDLMKENFAWYETKYSDSLPNIIKRISLPSDTVCFSCNPPVRNRVILP